MRKNKRLRVLFAGNSQGTAAGLGEEKITDSYPQLLRKKFKKYDVFSWTASYVSIENVNNQYNEIILQHSPDVVILQCGTMEASQRILPNIIMSLLNATVFGKKTTNFLLSNRRGWFKILNVLGIHFFHTNINQFQISLEGIINKCRQHNVKLIVLEIPFFSRQTESAVFPGNNKFIAKYNQVIKKLAIQNKITVIDPFLNNPGPSSASLFLKNTVHFSQEGHLLIAKNISHILEELSLVR